MKTIKAAALLVATAALLVGPTVAASAATAPDGTRVTSTQQVADRVLTGNPKPLQVSADKVTWHGRQVLQQGRQRPLDVDDVRATWDPIWSLRPC